MAKEPTKFPLATKAGTKFYHDVTGQTYVWGDKEQRSWRLVSDIENRTYTGPNAPDETFENLKNGDLWWDNEHFELRVYHKVLLDTDDSTGKETYSEGVWVSSTHPMMDPDEPEKMKQFGKIIITPSRRTFVEGSEFKFDAHLPYHNVPFDQWKVSATVTPSYLGNDPDVTSSYNRIFINFDEDTGEINGSLVCGFYPLDDEDYDLQESRRIQVKLIVEAHTDLEDELAEEFYADFYQTVTYGGFTGQIDYLPSHPPLIVDTIPFKEQLSDTLKNHAVAGVDLTGDKYQTTANETIRFMASSSDPNLNMEVTGRIDGAFEFAEDGNYPLSTQLPNVVVDVIHGGAKQLVMLFKYGDDAADKIAGNYDTLINDQYGVLRPTWQADYVGYDDVQGMLDNMRIAFFVDGEDDISIQSGLPLYTKRFEDMGIVTKFSADLGNGPVSITGQFIGLILNAENTKTLYEDPLTGRKRLYFACLKPTELEPTDSELDIHSSTKGYFEIENFTSAS